MLNIISVCIKYMSLLIIIAMLSGCSGLLERSIRTSYSSAVNEAVREINNIQHEDARRGLVNFIGAICGTCVGHRKY